MSKEKTIFLVKVPLNKDKSILEVILPQSLLSLRIAKNILGIKLVWFGFLAETTGLGWANSTKSPIR